MPIDTSLTLPTHAESPWDTDLGAVLTKINNNFILHLTDVTAHGGIVNSVAGRAGVVVLTPTDVPGVETTANKGAVNGYASLDSTGKVPSGQALVSSVAGKTGAVSLAATDVTGVEATANKGAVNGYASLDSGGLLTAAQARVSSVAGRTGDIVLAVTDVVGAVAASLVAAKGDVFVATASATPARLPVGTDGQILVADSSQTSGLKWSSVVGGYSPPVTTKGDLFGFDTAATRIPIGADGAALVADSAQTLGLKWAAPAPAVHHTTHATGGTDPIAPADIGALAASAVGANSGAAGLDSGGKVPIAQLPTGTTSTTVARGDDTRITAAEQATNKGAASGYMGLDSNSRGASAPQYHASTHAFGSGTDGISPVEAVTTANTGTAYTILDVTTSTIKNLTLTGNCTFTFPTAAAGKSFLLLLTQDGTGSRTATWPGTVKWGATGAPSLTTTASKTDMLSFVCVDGTNWLGVLSAKAF